MNARSLARATDPARNRVPMNKKRKRDCSSAGTLAGFAEHRSFAASFCDASEPEVLLHHLTRLEQAYRSRLPADLAADSSLCFALSSGRAFEQ